MGWIALDKAAREKLPAGYTGAFKKLNAGKLSLLYPGSPYLAAHILREQDQLHLMELHPQEYAVMKKVFRKDPRVHVHKRDGLEGVLALAPPTPRKGLVLVDPSYEIKEEYESIPNFIFKLLHKWPEACILVWTPMLPAGRHEGLVDKLQASLQGARVFRTEWAKPGEGMFGSVMIGINLPHGF